MAVSTVIVVGLGGLGVEVAKNIILAGVLIDNVLLYREEAFYHLTIMASKFSNHHSEAPKYPNIIRRLINIPIIKPTYLT